MATRRQIIEMNGHSNVYWGWGGEDDDFRIRSADAPSITLLDCCNILIIVPLAAASAGTIWMAWRFAAFQEMKTGITHPKLNGF